MKVRIAETNETEYLEYEGIGDIITFECMVCVDESGEADVVMLRSEVEWWIDWIDAAVDADEEKNLLYHDFKIVYPDKDFETVWTSEFRLSSDLPNGYAAEVYRTIDQIRDEYNLHSELVYNVETHTYHISVAK